MDKDVKILCVIPCLYEHLTVTHVIYRLKKLFEDKVYIIVVTSYENDPSIKKAIQSGADAVLVDYYRGYGLAILTGLSYLKNKYPPDKYVMIIDADDTYRLSRNFVKIIHKLNESENKYLVLGKRILTNDSMPLLNKIGNSFINKLIMLLGGLNINDSQSGLKIFPLGLYETLGEKGMSLSEEILLNSWLLGYKIIELPVVYVKRNSGTNSKLNIISDGLKIIKFTLQKVPVYRLRRVK